MTRAELSLFNHLRPSLWRRSKVAHIVLFSLGSLMLLPACGVMIAFYQMQQYFGSSGLAGMKDLEAFAFFSMIGSSCLGIVAWAAMGLLFFKRTDARWQRICWRCCSIFGWVATPSLIVMFVFAIDEGLPSEAWWLFLILAAMLATSFAAGVFGQLFSRSARLSLKQPPSQEDLLPS
jgi:hypothetical protein